ncbi:hypothetical protein M0811_00537 [Anaeramoeba ignava]|uniref:Uncharacterized protein n=1 Tax=Anaeramoeba ignava TaxID=1746090 RepID=A0A9Q0REJ2_ANAIG|nr:hypothetical protein M0811_00537 [Anaeramoeba ignava]
MDYDELSPEDETYFSESDDDDDYIPLIQQTTSREAWKQHERLKFRRRLVILLIIFCVLFSGVIALIVLGATGKLKGNSESKDS